MRERLPVGVIPVYDNYNALAVGFGPTDRVSDVIFSIAVFPRWDSLFSFAASCSMIDPERPGGVVIKSISARQRPRQ